MIRRVFLAALALSVCPGFAVAQERPDLVSRDRVRLNLAGAVTALNAAKAQAREMGLKSNVAVVDDGGCLVAFARMDGARPASVSTAIAKAVSAATFRQETGPLPAGGEPDVLLNLGIEHAGGGKVTSLKGGVPIVIDGQIVGAVGSGGGTGEQDAEVSRAGVQALLDALEAERRR